VLCQLWSALRRSSSIVWFAVVLGLVAPVSVSAQEQPSLFGDTVKRVLLDPTTYAPAAIAYDATMRDWNTSQPLFTHGYVEHNERFTLTGRPNDVPVSYVVGRNRILSDAMMNLELSVVNNVATSLVERALIDRFPEHPRLVRTLGWIERIGFSSGVAYYLSAQHYRQAGINEAQARQMGIR
jgi:hypothetical protein